MLGHDPAVLLNTYAAAVADGQRSAASVLGRSLSVAEQGYTGPRLLLVSRAPVGHGRIAVSHADQACAFQVCVEQVRVAAGTPPWINHPDPQPE